MADLAEQNKIGRLRAKANDGERGAVVDVKRDVESIRMVEPATLTRRVVPLPNERAGVFPFLAGVERLTLRRNATEPTRIKFASSIPHRVIRPAGSPVLKRPSFGYSPPLDGVPAKPEQDRCIRDAELLCDVTR